MRSLVMSLFSLDYIKMEIFYLKYWQCFNLLTSLQYSHSAWFLDGKTSILVNFLLSCMCKECTYVYSCDEFLPHSIPYSCYACVCIHMLHIQLLLQPSTSLLKLRYAGSYRKLIKINVCISLLKSTG